MRFFFKINVKEEIEANVGEEKKKGYFKFVNQNGV
jgi:hypothetical protein